MPSLVCHHLLLYWVRRFLGDGVVDVPFDGFERLVVLRVKPRLGLSERARAFFRFLFSFLLKLVEFPLSFRLEVSLLERRAA